MSTRDIILFTLILFFPLSESKIVGEIFGAQIEICETNDQIKIFDVQKINFMSDDECSGQKFLRTNDINTTFAVECEHDGRWKCETQNGVSIWNTNIKCSNLSIQSCHFTANVQELKDIPFPLFVILMIGVITISHYVFCK